MKTSLFFVISILFCLCGFLLGDDIPQWLYILASIAYVIYCVCIFKELKIRFLSYPILIFSLFICLFLCCMFGTRGEDASALGFVFIFAFMFVVLPIMFIALVIGANFDIKEYKNKQKIPKQIEETKNE